MFKQLDEECHDCKCETELRKTFEAFPKVYALELPIRDRLDIESMCQKRVERVKQSCIFKRLHARIMCVWTSREPTQRKVYVGFLRTKDVHLTIEPLILLNPCIVPPESLFQKAQMYLWIYNNSGALLSYLKKKEPDLSWKWETRGVNKVILRLKPI